MSSPTILLTLMGLGVGGAETHVVVLAKHLKDMGYNIIVASNGGVFEKELNDYDIKHYKVALNTKKPGEVIKSFLKLNKIVKTEKVDLIHAHSRIPAFICNIISKFHGIPFMTTGHYNFRTNFLLKRISAWGQRTIVVSQDLKEYFNNAFNVPEKNMTVITNGIETDKFKPGTDSSYLYEEFGIDRSFKKILIVSRVDGDLAQIMFNLIDTIDRLDEQYGKVAIFLTGTGNRIEEVKSYAEKKNSQLGKKVIFVTGGRTDIVNLVSFSDIFVGISRAALEAMSSEKPVILAGVWSFIGILDKDILEKSMSDNFTGRSSSTPATTEVLYDALSKLLAMSKEDLSDIGKFGRQIVLEHYSSIKMAEQTAKIYDELLNKGEKK